MKWIRRIAGGLGLMLFLGGLALLRGYPLLVKRVLGHYVGSEVQFETVAFSWLGKGKWQMHLRQIRIASTEPTIPFFPLRAEQAVITFQGRSLKKLEVERVSVLLFRKAIDSQTVRNYQKLFPRRGRGRPISLRVFAKKVSFYLFNQPAWLEVQAQVEEAVGTVAIDSVWVRLDQLEAMVAQLGVCYRGQSYGNLHRGRVHCAGSYQKATDSWETGVLGVRFPGLWVSYEGGIRRWTKLQGGIQLWVDSNRVKRWVELPALAESIIGAEVRISGVFEGDTIFFHAWGRGAWGQYEACGTWANKIDRFEGRLREEPIYDLGVRSRDGESWHLWGQGRYQGYPWEAKAHLSYASGAGIVTFRLGGLVGWYSGSLRQGNGALQWESLKASGRWDSAQGLELNLDTIWWSEADRFLRTYQTLWRRAHRTTLPWRVAIQQLEVSEDWVLREVTLTPSRGGSFQGRGELCYRPWKFCLNLEATIARGGLTGQIRGRSPDDKIYGLAEWQGDSIVASVAGFLYGPYYGQIKGCGSLTQRRFWVEEGRLQSALGSYMTFQGVVSDSLADGLVMGELFLPEFLAWRPLRGVELETGSLTGRICVQEPWHTLFSWDNQAEGWTRLSEVKGRFLKTDLPLLLSQAQIVFDPVTTCIENLEAKVGNMRLSGAACVQGTLGYIYEDWRALQGRVQLSVDGFRLRDVWRIRRGEVFIPRLLLPEKMNLHAEITARDVDILGFQFNRLWIEGAISEGVIRLDRVEADYHEGAIKGWGALETGDTACYMAAWQVRTERLPIQAVLTESGLTEVPAIQALGIQGEFAGEIQTAIRFAPNLTWRENSTLLAKGTISNGVFQTPSFFRWIRPLYIAAYRDSMDFLAQVPELTIVDGYLRLSRSLVLTRMAAFTIEGTHLLAQDQFLYRIQGTRVYRKAQRYPHLARLSPYLIDRLASSLWLIYIEKEKGRVRWTYPIKYLLSRLITG